MPRIVNDPNLATCPSFEDPEWDFLRQPMIDAHQGPLPLTAEEATLRMKNTWTRQNNNSIIAWNNQAEQDRAELAEQERLAQEEEEVQRVQREREAEELRREEDRKRPKLGPFELDYKVASWIETRPVEYALLKIEKLEYIELDYFTEHGRQVATTGPNAYPSQDTFGFTQVGGTLALTSLSQRPARNIRNDEELSWEEVFDAKNTMLHFMALSTVWPAAHAESLAAFYVALEIHPRRRYKNGKQALLVYQSRVRREWFSAFRRKKGFNIEIINEELLRTYADMLNDSIREKEIEQVRVVLAPREGPY
jgi:hypothetical protein